MGVSARIILLSWEIFLDRVLDSGSGGVNLRCYSAQNEIARGCSL